MKALILAGGYATRLWPLTKESPKPLLLMDGKPLITHIVDKIPLNIEIYVSTNKKFKKQFSEWKKNLGRPVHLIIEETRSDKEKLGAIASIGQFIKEYRITDDLLIIAGDNFFHFQINDFLKNYKGFPLVAAHNVKSFAEAKRFGVVSVRGSKISAFSEKPLEPKSTLVSTGVYLFPASIYLLLYAYLKVQDQKKDNLGSFIEYLIKKTEVRAYVFTQEWFDIGSFEGYLHAHKNQKRARTAHGERGAFFGVDFVGTVSLKGSVFIDKGSFIKNSKIIDSIILGDCVIKDSIIKNSIVDSGSSILNSQLKDELIEKGSRIKNFKEKSGRKN